MGMCRVNVFLKGLYLQCVACKFRDELGDRLLVGGIREEWCGRDIGWESYSGCGWGIYFGGGGGMRDESRIYWGSSLRLRSSGQL